MKRILSVFTMTFILMSMLVVGSVSAYMTDITSHSTGSTLSGGETAVDLKHIYEAGIYVGWARLGIHMGASRYDIVDWLQAIIGHSEASGFPFEDYQAPINNMISMINTGATMPEVAAVFDAWEPSFRAQLSDQTCAASVEPGKPEITSPAPGSTLSGSSETFYWTDNGTAVTKWWLYVGTFKEGYDIDNSGDLGSSTSYTVSGLPIDGSTVYVRLFYHTGGSWQYEDFTYTAGTSGGAPEITSPAPGSTLSGSSETFYWTDNGTAVTKWWLYVGTFKEGYDIDNSGDLGSSTSYTVSGLPADGSTVHVRLFYHTGGSWQHEDFTYTAGTSGGAPEITSPAPGSTLNGSSETFHWTNNGTSVSNWWLYVGTFKEGYDIDNSGDLGSSTSYTVSGLPADGSTVHVRLFYHTGGSWQHEDFTYTAATSGGNNETTVSWGANVEGSRGQNGKRVTFVCPPGNVSSHLWGTDLYTDDSSICTAGVHAGVITAAGGRVTIEIRPGAASYSGSTRYGVTSKDWGSWYGSFVVIGGDGGSTGSTFLSPEEIISREAHVKIVSKNSGKCMDVEGYSTENGAQIIQWDCHGQSNQTFTFNKLGIADGTFGSSYIVSIHADSSGKVLDILGYSQANYGKLVQWDWLGGDNQKFYFEPAGDNYYKIINPSSLKCLDVEGYSTENGAQIIQWDCHGGDNQLWRFESGTGTGTTLEDSVVGTWKWFNGATVTINSDGTVTHNTSMQGKWQWLDLQNRQLEINWENGRYIDELTLSADGNAMSGSNQYGTIVSATRN